MVPVSESVLSQRLRALRESRRVSRPEAERLGRLGSGTVKAWESGSRTPRGPALARLLDALQATDRQRAELIALADPYHARLSLSRHPAGPPIDLGIVLRAFRLRKGWTQADAARALGVTQGAVAHWETGERQLEKAALHQALFTLGATQEEVAATLASPHGEGPLSDDPTLVRASIDRMPGILREPFLLANERTLWWRAAREPGGDVDLLHAMTQRAIWYVYMRRFEEIEPLLNRIRQMAPDLTPDPSPTSPIIVLADVRFRPNSSTWGLVRRLEGIASDLAPSPQRAWARGTQAIALATLGERRSVEVAEQAIEESSQSSNPMHESWNRIVDLAEVHFRLGEPERALDTLESGGRVVDDELWKEVRNPSGLAIRARAFAALGREPNAGLMQTLRTHSMIDGTPFSQNRLDGVERDLATMRRRNSPSPDLGNLASCPAR